MADDPNIQQQIEILQQTIDNMEKAGAGEETLASLRKQLEALERQTTEPGQGISVSGDVDTQGGDFIGRDQINIYQGRYEGHAPKTNQEKRLIYCQYIAQQAGALPLRGMDRKESDAGSHRKTLSLSGVYTSLDIQLTLPDHRIQEMLSQGQWLEHLSSEERNHKSSREQFESLGSEQDESSEIRPVSALEAAILSRKWVLVGDPGSGKTTFVNYLTQSLAQQNFENLSAWPGDERRILPIVVILRDYYHWAQSQDSAPNSNLLWSFICHDLKTKNLAFADEILDRAIESGQAILMLDGLDEVPPGDARLLVKNSVLAFHQRYPKNRYLVTCRVLSYQNPKWQLPKEDFLAFELAPFSPGKIQGFIKAWYSEVAQKWDVPATRTQALAEKLTGAVQRPDLARLAPNPLLLTVMALVHTEYGELPDNRAQLYQQAVDVLLWRWEQEKSKEQGGQSQLLSLLQEADRDRNDLLLVLGRLAFEAHHAGGDTEDPDAVSGITQINLLTALRELHPQRSLDWAEKIVGTMRLRAGLLLDRDGTIFTFPHRTFQEYLAGTHLALMPNFPLEACKLVEAGSFWRVVVLLAVGHLAHNLTNRSMPPMLVNELCPENNGNDELAWQKTVVAGEALVELGINRARDSETGRSALRRVRIRLTEIVEQGLWTPTLRSEAGGVLGQLGDPRFDTQTFYMPQYFRGQPEPTLGFVRIPAGSFLMGSKEDDQEAYSDEHPQHEVDIPYDYWMARYPVTVAQFKAFVEAKNHQPQDRRSVTENPSWPVRYVSWHEARAYSAWLTGALSAVSGARLEKTDLPDTVRQMWQGLTDGRLTVRLPTEAEWEKAARGTAPLPEGEGVGVRVYPWGNQDWDAERANIDASRIGHPSPVGMYPQGATSNNLFDLSGNLREWTTSLWGSDLFKPEFKYPYDPTDGREKLDAPDDILRVVRGGSWLFNVRYARCAYRDWGYSVNFNDLIGFRIVLSPG